MYVCNYVIKVAEGWMEYYYPNNFKNNSLKRLNKSFDLNPNERTNDWQCQCNGQDCHPTTRSP